MYDHMKRTKELYNLLEDQLSKEIFQARLKLDLDYSAENSMNIGLLARIMPPEERQKLQNWKKEFLRLKENERSDLPVKVIIYGTSVNGQWLAKLLTENEISFFGFCGRGATKFPDGLMGKPVISPDELFSHPEEYYVVIAAIHKSFHEIFTGLQEHHFPEDHIIQSFMYFFGQHLDDLMNLAEKQYFEFPELYRRGTAFVDVGCLDSLTSRNFSKYCDGQYSKIIAFEPDVANFVHCQQNAEAWGLSNFEVIQAGLSDCDKTVNFLARGNMCSIVVPEPTADTETIRTVALDNVVGDTVIGFLKMDIEGSEYAALHGAEQTIKRDKPLLAISVYHRSGDVLAIMDYIQTLVPEYRFWLRHYNHLWAETVLYAAI